MMFSHLQHITFAQPWVLVFIPIVALLGVLWFFFMSRQNLSSLRISSTEALKGFGRTGKALVRQYLPLLRILTISFLLLAIARPQSSFDEEKVTTEGIDIVIAMDVSTSMLARDFKPNRLDAAKEVAENFIDSRKHDRIGVVVFAGESFTQCPVTIDHIVVKNQIKQIKNGILEDGTAIGNGLGTSIQRIKNTESKSKVVILMTDGVNNRGTIDPLTAADIALQFKVRVYTIGVGSTGQAYTPVAMTQSGELIYDYAPVQIDEALLKDISKKTGGQYFRANNEQKLKEIYQQIDKLEKTKIEVSAYERKTEKFHAFAFVSGILVLLEMLLRYWIVRSIP